MHVSLLAAITADGFIGRSADDRSFDWTSPEDKQFYIKKIKEADAIVIGMRTFKTFSRYPKGSRWIIYTRTPETFSNPKPEVITAEATNEDPHTLIARLKKEGVNSVAISGGSSVYTMFLQAGLLDTLYLTVEPVVFGQGIKLFAEAIDIPIKLTNLTKLSEQTVLLEYTV